MSQPVQGPDWQTIATVAGYIIMAILGFLGARLWNDVRLIKENWITRKDLDEAMARSDAERDSRHNENTGNFRRLEDKFDERLQHLENRQNETAVTIEKSIGQVLVEVAKIPRGQPRTDGPERRSRF